MCYNETISLNTFVFSMAVMAFIYYNNQYTQYTHHICFAPHVTHTPYILLVPHNHYTSHTPYIPHIAFSFHVLIALIIHITPITPLVLRIVLTHYVHLNLCLTFIARARRHSNKSKFWENNLWCSNISYIICRAYLYGMSLSV